MFEKLDNFRDFGGYPTRDGRRLRTGRLYRSAHHADLTDADLERLEGLGVAVVVDLRRRPERERFVSRRPAGFTAQVIENDIAAEEADSWLAFIQETDDLTPEAFCDHMRGFYREGAFEARHIDLYSRYFDALAQTDGAVLIHCAAGKDRTGILAGLTHHLAGVPDAHILHDYLLTNADGALARRVAPITAYIAEATGRVLAPEAVLAGLECRDDYLALAFEAMARRCGSVDGYLRDVLGVDAAKRQAILNRLVI